MRTIRLEMIHAGPGSDKHAGPAGEHRMTRLVIPLPALPPKSKVQSCVLMLSLDSAAPVASPLILPGAAGDAYLKGKLACYVLPQRQTCCRVLRVQLECYSNPEGRDWIARTEISERIMFSPALTNSLESLPEALAAPGAISELISLLPALRELLAGGGLPDDLQALVDAAVKNALAPWITALWNGLNGPSQK